MAVKIRLARFGTKKRPYYRIVAADVRMPRDGRYLEHIGSFNPLLPKDSEDRVKMDEERIKYWLSVGAEPTDRIKRFLDAAGILKREPRNNPNKGKPGRKRLEREAEAAAAKAAVAEAAEAAKVAAKEAAAEAAEASKAE